MTPVHAATQECFAAIRQLRSTESGGGGDPDALQRRLKGYLDTMRQRLAQERFPPHDVDDITYALVALADEVALQSTEALANVWMTNLLQFQYFKENTAGEGFFSRLEAIRREGNRRPDALRVYAWCLAFGFQGRYRIRGDGAALLDLTESLQREVNGLPRDVELSPDGERPSEALANGQKRTPLLYLAVGLFAAVILTFAILKISLSASMSSLRQDMSEVAHP